MKKYMRILSVIFILGLFLLSGCAATMNAIEHRNLEVETKMSESIFLNPLLLSKKPRVLIRVSNTSDLQIDVRKFTADLAQKIAMRGPTIVVNNITGEKPDYILQVNILYMDYEKQGMTADTMLAGGFGGALAGSTVGSGWKANTAGAAAGAAVGSVIGGLVGSVIKVERYVGAVDVQIMEKVPGGVKGKMTTNARQGTATQFQTERNIQSDYQIYRTRIVTSAVQTNMDKKKACEIITDRLTNAISNLF